VHSKADISQLNLPHGEEDLRCRSLLTLCQRCLGLSEAEGTRLEKYSFLEDRMSLWYWLRRDLSLSGNSLRQTVHTHCASVHQAAKLVAALLRVAGVTADLVESNGSLPPGL